MHSVFESRFWLEADGWDSVLLDCKMQKLLLCTHGREVSYADLRSRMGTKLLALAPIVDNLDVF